MTLGKNFQVLLYALTIFLGSVECVTSRVQHQHVECDEEITSAPFSRTESMTVFLKNRHYLNQEDTRDFFDAVRRMPESPLSAGQCDNITNSLTTADAPFNLDDTGNPNSQPAVIQGCSSGDLLHILDLELYRNVCPEMPSAMVREDPGEEAIKLAIEVAEKTIESLKELSSFVLTQVDKARKDIYDFQDLIKEITEEDLTAYTTTVATATIILNNAAINARNIYVEMLDLVEASLEIISLQKDEPDDVFVRVMIDTQFLMTIALEFSAGKLTEISLEVQNAQIELNVAKGQSERLAQQVLDVIDNKDGALDSKKNTIRGAVYGGCAATCFFPPACVICYAAGVPIVETEIASLEDDLANTKDVLRSISNQFLTLGDRCTALSIIACEQYRDMTTVRDRLLTTEKLIQSDSALIWKKVIPPRLNDLKVLLLSVIDDQIVTFRQLTSFVVAQGGTRSPLTLNGRDPPSDKLFPTVKRSIYEFSGEPDCTKFGDQIQPSYTSTPGGGNSCKCSRAQPGFVYAWSKRGDNNTKIGCAAGTTEKDCERRIKEQIGPLLKFNEIEYKCAQLESDYEYDRKRYQKNGSNPLTVCNAAEYKLQDYFYCKKKWLGRDGIGKPAGAKVKSEWFSVPISEVTKRMKCEGIIRESPGQNRNNFYKS